MAERRFRVDASFRELFPAAVIGTVWARGLDNSLHAPECAALPTEAARSTAVRLGEADLESHPAVAPWREAYRAFGAKPTKFRSSIENLLRSARAGSTRSIN
ncbi:MAG: hypothetical protein ACRDG4_00845, partial [Chloroflexota bacterium]